MKILYTGLQKENYNPKRGYSFEYNNFFLTLKNIKGIEIVEHAFDQICEVGRKKFNEELLEITKREKPELLFAFMYTDELDPSTLLAIKEKTNTKTIAWFADDYWRFWNYSKHWVPYFDWIVTTYSKAAEWYRQAGFLKVIHLQWACNTAVYRPLDMVKDIDVSFVGQYKPPREKVIRVLQDAGISVEAFGFGWPNGRVSQDEMLKIFSRSKINLNLSARPSLFSPRVLARLFFKKSINRLVPDFRLIDNFRAWRHFAVPHTHARPFELAGCKAFVISGLSEDLPNCYEDGKEMVFYRSLGDLVQKIKYYLAHNEERKRVAERAYERTMREHTYERRFEEILKLLGVRHV